MWLRTAIVAALAPLLLAASFAPTSFPPSMEKLIAAAAPLTAEERQTLLSGAPVGKLLADADAGKEVAVFGAVWMAASISDYVRRLKDIEHFESGSGIRITKRISDPPRLDDFDRLEIPEDDFADLRNCRVGACELKLSEASLLKLRSQIDWNKPTAKADAEKLMRRVALEYVTGYREGGNARLAVYRDTNRPTFVAKEFESMVQHLPGLATMPDLRDYLLKYPAVGLANSSDFFYWQEAAFGLKPTVRINHVVIQDRPGETVIASKMLYASHYFWTALERRVLVPDPARGKGFWLMLLNRSRSDGLSGLVGRVIRGRVRNEALRGTIALLEIEKSALESAR